MISYAFDSEVIKEGVVPIDMSSISIKFEELMKAAKSPLIFLKEVQPEIHF